jgi:hypothetical protein
MRKLAQSRDDLEAFSLLTFYIMAGEGYPILLCHGVVAPIQASAAFTLR